MSRLFLLCLTLTMAVACNKPAPEPVVETHPPMVYKEFADTGISFGEMTSFDINNDGEKDVLLSTQLVGDPVEQKDKKQWMITTSFSTSLPVNNAEQIPVLRYLDSIPLHDFSGFSWFNASSIVLSQKTITMTTPPYWEGLWKDASHRFIPVQLKKQNGLYNGWIEISFSTRNEELILHKAAICKDPNESIQAGR